MAGIDTHNEILEKGLNAKIFALVHDSILAEVPEDEVDEYCSILEYHTHKDRGVSIENTPVGCDFDIADDYSLGKFETFYADKLQES